MIRDRLDELLHAGFSPRTDIAAPDDVVFSMAVSDDEPGSSGRIAAGNGKSKRMEGFFAQIEALKDQIGTIEADVDSLSRLYGDILANPFDDPVAREQIEHITSSTKKHVKKVRTDLQAMDQRIKSDEKAETDKQMAEMEKRNAKQKAEMEAKKAQDGRGHSASPDGRAETEKQKAQEGKVKIYHSADVRIRRSQHSNVTKIFVAILQRFNSEQVDYKERLRGRITKQLDLTGRNVTQDQLDEMLDSGNPRVFEQGIIQGTADAKRMLADIQTRHEDIMKLEKSMRELHEMFVDMAILVESQGEMINRIEFNVEQAAEYVDSASEAVQKAYVYQKKVRQKKICLIMYCTLTILVVILIVIIYFAMQKSDDSGVKPTAKPANSINRVENSSRDRLLKPLPASAATVRVPGRRPAVATTLPPAPADNGNSTARLF